MTFLLDTNVVSELRKPNPDRHVLTWAEQVGRRDSFISVVTIREIEAGVLAIERRDAMQGAMLRAWLEGTVLVRYADRLLPIDLAIARRAASLHVSGPRPERDMLIAATALEHGLTVVTRNTADFEPTGAGIVNPWLPH